MNPDRKKLKLVSGWVYTLLPFALLLRLYMYWTELDPETGFFTGSSLCCFLYNAAAFALFFLCLGLGFLKPKEEKNAEPQTEKENDPPLPPLSEPPSADEDLLFLEEDESLSDRLQKRTAAKEATLLPDHFSQKAVTWHGAGSSFSCFLLAFALLAHGVLLITDPALKAHWPLAAASLVCGLFLWISTMRNRPTVSKLRAFGGLLPVLWCTSRLILEYRDITRFLNKGVYAAQFLFVIAALIFFTYLAQLSLGERALSCPNSLSFAAVPVVFLGVSTRLAQLIAFLFQKASLEAADLAILPVDLAITALVFAKLEGILSEK